MFVLFILFLITAAVTFKTILSVAADSSCFNINISGRRNDLFSKQKIGSFPPFICLGCFFRLILSYVNMSP